MILSDIATVRSGHSFRTAVESDPDGDVFAIQIRDITRDCRIDWEDAARIRLPEIAPSKFLREGEILFASRGTRHAAAFVDSPPGSAVAGVQFFIIRVKDREVDPEYLAWWLNQRRAQVHFHRSLEGTVAQVISKRSVEQTPVEIPAIELQRRIIALHRLHREEKELRLRLEEKRDQLFEAAMLQALEPARLPDSGRTSSGRKRRAIRFDRATEKGSPSPSAKRKRRGITFD